MSNNCAEGRIEGSQGRGGRALAAALVLAACVLLGGCSVTELEDRGFPLAIAIDTAEEGMVVSFDLPNLSAVSDGKNPSGEPVSLSVEGGAYYQAQKAYENNTNKVLDYNHLKAIILSRQLLEEDGALRELLAWLEGEEVLARNTCLFAAEDSAAQILTLTDRTETSVGNYLEQMVETQKDFRENKVVTIGSLMNQWHNQNELLLLPSLADNGGIPSITSYLVMDGFEYKGSITVEQAMEAFLCQGMLSGMTYRLKEGAVVTLEQLRAQLDISREEIWDEQTQSQGEYILVTVRLKGDGILRKGPDTEAMSAAQLREGLNEQLQRKLTNTAESLQKELGVDMTNSFYRLGGYDRELYRQFREDYEGYREQLRFRFICDFQIGSE